MYPHCDEVRLQSVDVTRKAQAIPSQYRHTVYNSTLWQLHIQNLYTAWRVVGRHKSHNTLSLAAAESVHVKRSSGADRARHTERMLHVAPWAILRTLSMIQDGVGPRGASWYA